MGNGDSAPRPQPQPRPPSPTFRQEWRKIPWGHPNTDLQFVMDYQPHNNEVQQLRILVYGPAGAGKSSFINSVDSVLKGRICGRAFPYDMTGNSFTLKYQTYKIQRGGPEMLYPFSLTDTMGLEKDTLRGTVVEDIKQAMMGHINDGYTFNPASTISEDDPYYNANPTLQDKVHVLVCVVSAANAYILEGEFMRKMREVRLAASSMGIPQVAILTKIDEAFTEVRKDIKNVYKSKFLKKRMEELNMTLGIPLYRIFPVKNYHSEIDTNADTDALILSALRRIINFGEDFLNDL